MKKALALTASAASFLTMASVAFAQTPGQVDLCPKESNGFNILCYLNPSTALPTVITFILVIAVIIALIYLIWGGIKWITSGGDKGNVETARNQIIAALIGLIVVFLAWFLINLILTVFLGAENADGVLELPTIDGAAQG